MGGFYCICFKIFSLRLCQYISHRIQLSLFSHLLTTCHENSDTFHWHFLVCKWANSPLTSHDNYTAAPATSWRLQFDRPTPFPAWWTAGPASRKLSETYSRYPGCLPRKAPNFQDFLENFLGQLENWNGRNQARDSKVFWRIRKKIRNYELLQANEERENRKKHIESRSAWA